MATVTESGTLPIQPQKGRKRVKVVVCVLLAITLLAAGTYAVLYYARSRKIQSESITAAVPTQATDEYVASQKEKITSSSFTEAEKIEQRVAAANYYSGVYNFDRVIQELDLVAKDYPAAANDHFYLVSYFSALQQTGNSDKLPAYAKKIVELEAAGKKSDHPIPPALRETIDEQAH